MKWATKTLVKMAGWMSTIFLGSIFIFVISKNVKVDKVEKMLAIEGIEAESTLDYKELYRKKYIALKEHLPLFYFEIIPSHHCPNKRQFSDYAIFSSIRLAEKEGYDCHHLSGTKVMADVQNLQKVSFPWPVLYWYGSRNQYHTYLLSVLSGDWGISVRDGKAVGSKIQRALGWTLSIVLLNFVLALVFSILLAVFLWKRNNSRVDHFIQALLHALYSIPGFWLATLVLIFFTGPQYGMPIFYTPLYTPGQDQSLGSEIWLALGKIAPVVFCLTLQDIAMLTRLIRSKIAASFQEPFMDVIKTRGISDNALILRHSLPNALLPLITLFFNSLPASIAGSLVFEVVFNIPGMGRLLNDSIQSADWPVVYGITLLSMITTVAFYAMGDSLYRRADPRIR